VGRKPNATRIIKKKKLARWRIVDIPKPWWQLTTLKKEDNGHSKGHPRSPITNKKQSSL
jgi:hypothetical protein